MDIKRFKKFIVGFLISIILLSFCVPQVSKTIYSVVAATISGLDTKGAIKSGNVQQTMGQMLPKINGTAVPETTRRKSVGHAVEGAEYHDELWEKYNVIAAEDGGGLGKGGGANSKHSQVVGNMGDYDEMGGVFGGNGGNLIAEGGFGDSGSATADELRRLKAAIDESRLASISNEMANKLNLESIKESIEESEKIAASIQKKLLQEVVKSTLYIHETPHMQQTQKSNISPSYNPDFPINRIVVPETIVSMPTAALNERIETERKLGIVINKDRFTEPMDAIDMLRNNMTAPQTTEVLNAPTAAEVFEEAMMAPPETSVPVEPELPEQVYYDQPIIETVPVEPVIDKSNPVDRIESSVRRNEDNKDTEEIEATVPESEVEDGANGGENPEEEVDKKGDADSEEKSGKAEDKGLLHLAKEEEFKGKRIFEIDTTGNIGLSPDYISLINSKTFMLISLFILFILGVVLFFFKQDDKKSTKNYF